MRQATKRRPEADPDPVRVRGRGLRAQRAAPLSVRRRAASRTHTGCRRTGTVAGADAPKPADRCWHCVCVVVGSMLRWWGLWLVVLAIGCGEGGPPLDELPLRDALRAGPEVVAGLAPAARSRLAARLEAARTGDRTTDRLGDGTPAAEVVVGALDRLRVERQADPLLVGIISDR